MQFHRINKLKNIGLRIIRDLWQKRNAKRYKKARGNIVMGDYNPLNELKSCEVLDVEEQMIFVADAIEQPFDPDAEPTRRKHERRLDTMNSLIQANHDNDKVQLLLLSQNNTVKDIADEMGTSKYFINKDLAEIKETFKEHLTA